MMPPIPHFAAGRCWCDDFHRDQPTTLLLAPAPQVPGVPQFELAAAIRQAWQRFGYLGSYLYDERATS